MSHFDYSDLDGHLLQVLLAVFEEQSVTRAAVRLDVTQSAVSHLLDKLRLIVGDPLFVRSGRGIVATARAALLAVQARRLLEQMQGFAQAGDFDASRLDITLTVAANDLQRDLLLPTLLRRLQAQAPRLKLRVMDSGKPDASLLRESRCQIMITPRPPDASDLVQKRLFEDHYAVYFDPGQRAAPADLADYLASPHVTVSYGPGQPLALDQHLALQGVVRRFVAQLPGFAGVAAFLRGGDCLATLPSLLGLHALRGLASARPPLPCPPLPMYLVWHLRHQSDPLHQWLRRQIDAVIPELLPAGCTGS